jgi:hypothetical protein
MFVYNLVFNFQKMLKHSISLDLLCNTTNIVRKQIENKIFRNNLLHCYLI